ncbi:MAG: M67 family metallopeptidase [Bacillota bacterium]|nr:M67 family metallopeptidase [Bacillota bacterium]
MTAGTAPGVLFLPSPLQEALIRHGEREAPREACGLLGGQKEGAFWKAEIYQESANLVAGAGAYQMDPLAVLALSRRLEKEGRAWLGIVHSHPQGPPLPSPKDREEAYYPEVLYVIVGFWPKIEIRAYFVQDKAWRSIPIKARS